MATINFGYTNISSFVLSRKKNLLKLFLTHLNRETVKEYTLNPL